VVVTVEVVEAEDAAAEQEEQEGQQVV